MSNYTVINPADKSRDCKDCAWHELREYERPKTGFWGTTVGTEKTREAYCTLFQMYAGYARVAGYTSRNVHCSSSIGGGAHQNLYEITDGPCGADGKRWEARA